MQDLFASSLQKDDTDSWNQASFFLETIVSTFLSIRLDLQLKSPTKKKDARQKTRAR